MLLSIVPLDEWVLGFGALNGPLLEFPKSHRSEDPRRGGIEHRALLGNENGISLSL